MADFLDKVLAKLAPLHLRTFGKTLIGDRSDITEDNLTEKERLELAKRLVDSTQGVDFNKVKRAQATSYGGNVPADIKSTFGAFAAVPQKDGGFIVEDRYDFWPGNSKAVPLKTGKYDIPLKDPVTSEQALRGKAGWLDRGSAILSLIGSAIEGEDDPGDELPNIALNGASRNVRVKLNAELIKKARAELAKQRTKQGPNILDEDE